MNRIPFYDKPEKRKHVRLKNLIRRICESKKQWFNTETIHLNKHEMHYHQPVILKNVGDRVMLYIYNNKGMWFSPRPIMILDPGVITKERAWRFTSMWEILIDVMFQNNDIDEEKLNANLRRYSDIVKNRK
jgi:hypothetical protein